MANPQPTRNYWCAFWAQKMGIHSQPTAIGQPTANLKLLVRILGTKSGNPWPTRSQPATNPQLLARILDTRKWESMANLQPT
jgi:hypothetical protein